MRKFIISVNGQQYDVEVEEVKNAKNSAASAANTTTSPVQKAPAPAAAVSNNGAASNGAGVPISAPMPGNILKINVQKGDVVKRGQSLLILEAMKMENEITAPSNGKIGDIKVSQGECVTVGQTLVELI